jgi:hypothetical protein
MSVLNDVYERVNGLNAFNFRRCAANCFFEACFEGHHPHSAAFASALELEPDNHIISNFHKGDVSAIRFQEGTELVQGVFNAGNQVGVFHY